ncbi:hypothetical protein HMPREF0239_04374, partial [Clostridium sp. ATCC BAA-442]
MAVSVAFTSEKTQKIRGAPVMDRRTPEEWNACFRLAIISSWAWIL